MATGRIVMWRERGDHPGQFYGYIADAAFGAQCPTSETAYFDGRDLLCERGDITRGVPVAFEYDMKQPATDRPHARKVRPIDQEESAGVVLFVTQRRPSTAFGFVRDDETGADYYFDSRDTAEAIESFKTRDHVRFLRDTTKAPIPREAARRVRHVK